MIEALIPLHARFAQLRREQEETKELVRSISVAQPLPNVDRREHAKSDSPVRPEVCRG